MKRTKGVGAVSGFEVEATDITKLTGQVKKVCPITRLECLLVQCEWWMDYPASVSLPEKGQCAMKDIACSLDLISDPARRN